MGKGEKTEKRGQKLGRERKKGATRAPGKGISQTKFHIGGIYRWMDFRSLGDWHTSDGAIETIPRREASFAE